MTVMRLKLAGLNGVDKNSLNSMLRLSADLLTQEWIIVDGGHADLVIYAFDTDVGQQAWRDRKPGLTALLTNTGNVSEPVDIVLRKPLRKSNFSEALNLVEEKIRFQREPAKNQSNTTSTKETAQKSGWTGKLLETIKPVSYTHLTLPTIYSV